MFKTENLYEKGFNWVFKFRKIVIAAFLVLIIPGFLLGWKMPKERFPSFNQSDVFVKIDWNERINLDENILRLEIINSGVSNLSQIGNSYVGTQKYMLHKDMDQSVSEALLYFSGKTPEDITNIQKVITDIINTNWTSAIVSYQMPETIFEKLFQQEEAFLVLKISNNQERGIPDLDRMNHITADLSEKFPDAGIMPRASESYIEVSVLPEMLALYDVEHRALYERLRAALNAWQVGVLHTGSQYVPMVIGNSPLPVNQMLNELMVVNRYQLEIPVKTLVNTRIKDDYKTLFGSNEGAFVPIDVHSIPGNNAPLWMAQITEQLKSAYDIDPSFAGSWFSSRQLIRELVIVMLISLSLLYFILAAQFESLRQPLILLLEVPIDIAGAFSFYGFLGVPSTSCP